MRSGIPTSRHNLFNARVMHAHVQQCARSLLMHADRRRFKKRDKWRNATRPPSRPARSCNRNQAIRAVRRKH
jgi:hypothetical protein